MNIKRATYFLGFLIFTLCFSSCEKDLLRDNPLDENNPINITNDLHDIDSGLVITDYEIYQDSNNDDVVSKGETIRLTLNIKNKALTTLNSVKLSITSSSVYISNISNYYGVGGYKNISFANLQKDQKEDHNGLTFNVSNDTPEGTVLVFDVEFKDADNQIWKSTFSITTVKNSANIIYSKSSIYSDSNSDNVINKGESIRMNLFIKNAGSSTAKGLKVAVTTSSPYISSISNYYSVGGYSNVTYGDLSMNQEENHTGLTFNVSSSTPNETVIQFEIVITDIHGNTWDDIFTVKVKAQGSNIVFSKYSIYSDSNNDGIINKGEGILLDLVIKNTGISTAKEVSVTVKSTSPYISNLKYYYNVGGFRDIIFGDITANQEVNNNGLMFTVSSSAPNGAVINFTVDMEDKYGNTWTDSFSVTVAATMANLTFSKSIIYSDSNSNGKAEAGESIRLITYIKNTGLSLTSGTKVTIKSTSSSITGLANYYAFGGYSNVNYGNLSMNQEESHTGLMFNILVGTPKGTVIQFSVILSDQYGNTWNDSFSLTTQ